LPLFKGHNVRVVTFLFAPFLYFLFFLSQLVQNVLTLAARLTHFCSFDYLQSYSS